MAYQVATGLSHAGEGLRGEAVELRIGRTDTRQRQHPLEPSLGWLRPRELAARERGLKPGFLSGLDVPRALVVRESLRVRRLGRLIWIYLC